MVCQISERMFFNYLPPLIYPLARSSFSSSPSPPHTTRTYHLTHATHLDRLAEVPRVLRILKGIRPDQHHVQRHTARPRVRRLPVILFALKHLWGDIGRGAHCRLGLGAQGGLEAPT